VPSYRLNFGARSFRVAAPMFGTLFLQTFVHVHCTCHLETFIFMLLLTNDCSGHLVTLPAPPIRCLCVDFVRVTNCFYDYNYDYDIMFLLKSFHAFS